MLPDLISEFTEIDLNHGALGRREGKARKPSASSIATRKASAFTTSRNCCAPIASSRKTCSTSSRKTKSSSSTNTPAAKCRAAAGATDCIRRSKRRKASQIDRETQTLATITIQNYFRLYHKLAGMTGTAETEAAEFHDIYKLDVQRHPDEPAGRAQGRERSHLQDAPREIQRRHQGDQGIATPRRSRFWSAPSAWKHRNLLSRMLKREKIPHNVLNAKYHMQEAEIVARAGQPGTVTISTNMAGRGTDIKLGEGVAERRRACTSSAPSVTNRAASIGSCAAVARARAIPARRAFTSASRTI